MKKYSNLIKYSLIAFFTISILHYLLIHPYNLDMLLNTSHIIIMIITSITIGYLIDLKYIYEKTHKQLLKALHYSKMGFWELDIQNNKLSWSNEIYEIFEIDADKIEPTYEGFLDAIHENDREMVDKAYIKSLEKKADYSIEHRLLMDDGRIKWVREECKTKYDTHGNELTSVGYIIDITEQRLLKEIYIDYLTKLNNRKSYNETIEKLLSQYKRYKTPFSIIMYDIDDFKRINDTYGHNVGDNVLVDMSAVIKSHIRDSDYIFRVGGEEFIILLTETQIDKAKLVSEKIRDSVEKDLKAIKDETITISIGLTEVKEDDTEDIIFMRVDKLLYKSKNSGKNKISY